MPLAAVSGACLGTKVTLGAASLPFGTVVVGSQVPFSQAGQCITSRCTYHTRVHAVHEHTCTYYI